MANKIVKQQLDKFISTLWNTKSRSAHYHSPYEYLLDVVSDLLTEQQLNDLAKTAQSIENESKQPTYYEIEVTLDSTLHDMVRIDFDPELIDSCWFHRGSLLATRSDRPGTTVFLSDVNMEPTKLRLNYGTWQLQSTKDS